MPGTERLGNGRLKERSLGSGEFTKLEEGESGGKAIIICFEIEGSDIGAFHIDQLAPWLR